MTQGLNGPGIGLPPPQNLYPSALYNSPIDASSNQICLAAGDTLPIPAGDWYVAPGSYSILEFLDPVTNTWQGRQASGYMGSPIFVKSDGFNYRLANKTGCLHSISITSYGTGWVQASTTIAIVGSTATALPIVGGQLTLVGGTLTSNGAGYGVAPIVFIPPPPPASNNANGVGGIQASAYAVISSGTVSGITFTNPGAGYPTAPTAVIIPSPTDPNLSLGITQATVAFSLVGSGSITGALVTNHGAPITPANITITPAGAGSGATLTANVMQTIALATVVGTGLGYGTVAALGLTAGGGPAAGTITNGPDFLGLSFRPRQAQISYAITGGGTLAAQAGTIVDGGLFISAPNVAIVTNPLPGANVTISGATVALTMGSRPDIVTIQPGP